MRLALQQVATQDDVSIGQAIRDAISRDLTRRQKAKVPVRADARPVAPLLALLADDFAYSKNWADRQTRLHHKGHQRAGAGGGVIVQATDGPRICKGSETGYGHVVLLRHCNAPFPGQAHPCMLSKMRAERAAIGSPR